MRVRTCVLCFVGAAALFVAGGCLPETIDQASCPDAGTDVTYEDFVKPFMKNNCAYCHGADVIDRKGAPPAYVFDTREQVERFADRIYVRAAGPNNSMPPGPDDPPAEDRAALAEWLACAASGDAP